jgi:manganese transport protein
VTVDRRQSAVTLTETDLQRTEAVSLIERYPLSRAISTEKLAAEIATLDRLRDAPWRERFLGYVQLAGPGVLMAAGTLGAGALTSSMLMGAEFGYRTLWMVWLSVGLGLFMLAASARFTCQGGFRLIAVQNKYHGYLVGSVLTGLGVAFIGIVFEFAQYSVATHLIESLTAVFGHPIPRRINWVIVAPLTSWLVLLYGRKGKEGIRRIELFMKASVLLVLATFLANLVVVGVRWGELLRGTFIPWLPRGTEGITLLIAGSGSVGLMDWVLFHYAGLARGWGEKHETLARFDLAVGVFLPYVLVNFLLIAVSAATLHPLGIRPETAPELAEALAPALGHYWSQVLLYVGALAMPINTTVGMSIATAIAIHEAFGWTADTQSWRWTVTALLPQVGILGVWYPRPLWLVIVIGAFLSVTKNFVGWSFYLLLNDRRVLGEHRCQSYWWNLGVMLNVTLLNCMVIAYVLSRMGLWPK